MVCQPVSVQKKNKRSYVKNLSNVLNSASTKINVEEASSEEMPQVDLNVLTNPPSVVGDAEDMEFVLEVGDMQSAISNQFIGGDSSYNMKPSRKRHRMELLDDLYTFNDE